MHTGIEPNINNSNNPDPDLKKLQMEVAKLQNVCSSVFEVADSFILAFRPDEVPHVKAMISRWGYEAAVEHYSPDHKYHKQQIEDLDYEDPTPEAPLSILKRKSDPLLNLLQITIFRPPENEQTELNSYFRQTKIKLPETIEHTFLNNLNESGITELIFPDENLTRDSLLDIDNIVGLHVKVNWYGPENWYGNGTELILSLEIDCKEESPLYVQLLIAEVGQILIRVFDPEYIDGNYQGHSRKNIELSAIQLNKLRDIVQALNSAPESEKDPFYTGVWII